jgi:hypothetical protein
MSGLADRSCCDRPRLASRRIGQRILRRLAPTAAPGRSTAVARCGPPTHPAADPGLARPPGSQLAAARLVARGDRDQILDDVRQQVRDLPPERSCWPRMRATSTCCPRVRPTWIAKGTRQQVVAPDTKRRSTICGATDLQGGRWHYQLTRDAISATFTALCEHYWPGYGTASMVAVICDNVTIHRLQDGPALAGSPFSPDGAVGSALPRPRQPRVERIWGDHSRRGSATTHREHPGPRLPGPRLFPTGLQCRWCHRAAKLTVGCPPSRANLSQAAQHVSSGGGARFAIRSPHGSFGR